MALNTSRPWFKYRHPSIHPQANPGSLFARASILLNLLIISGKNFNAYSTAAIHGDLMRQLYGGLSA
jgi:hypothetical protein